MKIIECGTGYTSIPAQMGAATEIVVEELAKSFEKNDIDYEIFDIEDKNRTKNNLRIHEVKVNKIFRKKDTTLGIMHKLKRVFYSLSLAKELRKKIKKEKNICIHFHNQYNMFFFLKTTPKSLLKNVKIFYTVHSYIWNDTWNNIENIINKKYFQEVYSVKHADKVFILNKITMEHFTKHLGLNNNKIFQIDNGVNIDIYKPLEIQEDITFFQSGSVCDRKNQLSAIKNLKDIILKNEKVNYMYAGGIIDNEYKKMIDQYSSENKINNKVVYVGELHPGKELNEYYNKAKAFIFPSKAEAFSLVLLEAMSCGLPVIMDRNAIKEVDKDLENVILFYNNKEEFEKIVSDEIFNEKKRKELSKKSRELIEKKYSWDAIATTYFKEFEKEFK